MEHLEIAKESSKRAFNMSNLNTNDIDLTMIYDSFTITVLLSLEAIGFCKLGEGKDFVQNQRTAPGGDFALNTNGGGLKLLSSRNVWNIYNYRICKTAMGIMWRKAIRQPRKCTLSWNWRRIIQLYNINTL